jgi:hypothetical protein
VSPIYAFFELTPSIVTVDGWRVHEFRCSASNCKGHGKSTRMVRHYLDTTDRNSTGNLHKHAWLCWGEEAICGVDDCDLKSAREGVARVKNQKDGSLTTAFDWKGQGKVTYSHRQHSKAKTRFVTFVAIGNHLMYTSGPKSFVG